jgi:hypothetical protein
MKRLLLLVVVLLLGFYVAWPGWSAYQIDSAIKAKDTATLEHKIDFPSVRVSLRPAFTQKVSELYDLQLKQAGGTGALLGGQLKKDLIPGMVELLLNAIVTPENAIRVVHEGGQVKDSVDRWLSEEMARSGKLPGLIPGGGAGQTGGFQVPGGPGNVGEIAGKLGFGQGGGGQLQTPAAQPAPKPAPVSAPPPSYGIENIKTFSILGPLAFEIGVAKDKAATEPDVTAEMRFTGMDWKVTGVRLRL